MTFDDAQDAYRDNPTSETAATYLAVAREYVADGMLSEITLTAVLIEIAGR